MRYEIAAVCGDATGRAPDSACVIGHPSLNSAGAVSAAPALFQIIAGKRQWTAEGDRQLTSMWDAGFTSVVIGEALGLTKNAILGRVHRLGLSQRVASPATPRVHWEADEDATLRAMWGTARAADIGLKVGRSVKAVLNRASHLKLPRMAWQGPPAKPRVRVHRIGAGRRGAGEVDAARVRSATAPRREPKPMGKTFIRTLRQPAEVFKLVEQRPVQAITLAAPVIGACCWPMWPHATRPAYGEHRFCEAPRYDPRHRYCEGHADRAYVRGEGATA